MKKIVKAVAVVVVLIAAYFIGIHCLVGGAMLLTEPLWPEPKMNTIKLAVAELLKEAPPQELVKSSQTEWSWDACYTPSPSEYICSVTETNPKSPKDPHMNIWVISRNGKEVKVLISTFAHYSVDGVLFLADVRGRVEVYPDTSCIVCKECQPHYKAKWI